MCKWNPDNPHPFHTCKHGHRGHEALPLFVPRQGIELHGVWCNKCWTLCAHNSSIRVRKGFIAILADFTHAMDDRLQLEHIEEYEESDVEEEDGDHELRSDQSNQYGDYKDYMSTPSLQGNDHYPPVVSDKRDSATSTLASDHTVIPYRESKGSTSPDTGTRYVHSSDNN